MLNSLIYSNRAPPYRAKSGLVQRPEVDITVMLSPVSWLIPPCTSGALCVLARLLAAVRILHFGIA